MTTRPAAERIEDLLDPKFPPGVGEALVAMDAEADAIDWSVEAVWHQAGEASGLGDRGDDLGAAELALLVDIGRTSPTLRGAGRVRLWRSLVENATQRLLIVDYLRRHPEVHEIEIARPIIIAGQARTGTTHLHNLLAADPALRSLQYWESLEPVPPLAEQGGGASVDPRFVRTEEKLAGLNYALPYFKRMHDMYAAHVHEEIQLMMPAFGSTLWESSLADPRLRDHYLGTDQRPWYEWNKTVLRVCTHIGGGSRWVLKSPQHVEQLGTLMAVYPDATVVCTHRDPVAVSQSIATMITYTARNSVEPEHLQYVGRYWIDRIERMFHAYAADRELVSAAQSIDVTFDDFMADDVAMVERIYAVAEQPFTADVRAAMERFMAENPRGKHGRVRYDLADFGHDPTERAQALAFYSERFL